ncbi:bifunctional indole-3-glycerol-phosphate synthase TrpC/phosphoribosylanthranilate isomerase TrpF [Basfia succiniciproducens]|uniref:bifunctional indole-3-glycerol-phosphate synthase TrpC/phosphoribosylanthranilate isomerase TrpF n=1 Tax=Basfia succiniciproducens TaxID=653940 RepID=UPI0008C46741|nr:bifunctional indole-3-glycerol-phosphate synthase TrpC/phosphoribosylanthranilate isomerase TrpF [Basfia succiniciproducens]SEP88272.1 phosphoribosylanthranilate isomerase /indole-3-glycerol phosphate synthase [Basfia succiniciproducens]
MNLNDKPTILQKIVADKIQWIKAKEQVFPLASFKEKITKSDRSFYQSLGKGTHQNPVFILECKKASPSKGLIRNEFNPVDIAQVYKNYAAAVSVLTDEKYFQGDFSYIKQVRDIVTCPVLCKDFMISEYQVYLARYYQADAILLMLSVLDDETYKKLAALAHELGMGVLTETSNQQELERGIALGAKVMGINNRNLHDLTVDLARTPPLAQQIPADRIIVSESGIYSHQQVQQLKPYVNAFLIGSSLMGSDDLNNAVRSVIFGENKVCGLTRPQDVQEVYRQGALYGGLIFAENSKRCVSLRQAQELVTVAPLRFVGVFQNQQIDFIVKIATQLNLYAVQLHGAENEEFIAALRIQLPHQIQIWQAVSIDVAQQSAVKIDRISAVDRYVLDSKTANRQGGTGVAFDWSKIPAEIKNKSLLAGGITPENIELALAQHCLGIDLNSGVESAAGIKNPEKLTAVFNKIHRF